MSNGLLKLPVFVITEKVNPIWRLGFVVVVIRERFGLSLFILVGLFSVLLIGEVVSQICLTNLEGREVAFGRVVHIEVGFNTAGLNRTPRRRVVTRRSEFYADSLFTEGHRQNGLHRPLAKRAVAQKNSALVILQCTGHNFGCRG